MLMKSGIYKIINLVNKKYYIGSSVNMSMRWSNHKKAASDGKNNSPHLYSSMRKYGVENFAMEPLIVCEKDDLLYYEQKLLDIHIKNKDCYNCSDSAEAPWRGKTLPSYIREKISKTRKERKIAVWNKGIPRTDIEKLNISRKTKEAMAKLDNSPSYETRKKLSDALKGRKFSDITKKKMSRSKKGLPTWNKNKAHPTAAKLTKKQVLEIRKKYKFRVYGCYKLAKEYNVHNSTIDAIINNRTWKHL